MIDFYKWVVALHVISVICWMAGIFYLPRLFVYHVDAPKGSQQSETFKIMERRLMRGIMNPAMIASWLFGLILAFGYGVFDFSQGWVWVKLSFVILMTVFHMALSKFRKEFLVDQNTHTGKFYRAVNEIPTVLMLVIVIMVIVKPF